MGVLAVRVDALLNEVRGWPLAGAVDYLIEHGLTIVDGWHPLRRGRMDSLRRRFAQLFKQVGMASPPHWYLCRLRGEASVVGWRFGSPSYPIWAWEVAFNTAHLYWWTGRRAIPGRCYRLPEVVGLWANEFTEEWVCDMAILLFCVDHCYRRR